MSRAWIEAMMRLPVRDRMTSCPKVAAPRRMNNPPTAKARNRNCRKPPESGVPMSIIPLMTGRSSATAPAVVAALIPISRMAAA